MVSSLAVLRNEISNELKFIGDDKFPDVEKLAIGKLDSAVLQGVANFLVKLREYYGLRAERVTKEREDLVAQLTSTPEKMEAFVATRDKYSNRQVAEMVENVNSPERIVEYKGTLVQKIYPIYLDDHKPSNMFDFSANLYQPTKHFAGVNHDTLKFNIGVIWSMTLALFITLYLDVLKRLIKRLEGSRKFKGGEK
jgi:hypothetical protein